MNLSDKFGPPSPSGYRSAKIGIVELLVCKSTWICRIGFKQWDGPASSEDQAILRSWQCAADQLREPVGLLMKFKKAGLM